MKVPKLKGTGGLVGSSASVKMPRKKKPRKLSTDMYRQKGKTK